jgi:16S rRNA (guanine966-N2)-methyltransferase
MAKRSNAKHAPGAVRVIAGEWRGRKIAIPEGTDVRPTPDRVRVTLFNWLRESIPGARCLDLFAGTGVLGFEALSRGAEEVWFVEHDAKLVAGLQESAAAFGAQPQVIRRDVLAFLREPAVRHFDLVFLDPPYALPVEPFLELLPAWLTPRALVYVERPRSEGLPEVPTAEWLKRSHAGAVEYGLLRWLPSVV